MRCASFLAAVPSVSAVFAETVLNPEEERGAGEGWRRWRGLKFSMCSGRGVVAQVGSCLEIYCVLAAVNMRKE